VTRRKDRLLVVLDTNVVVGFLLSTTRQSANQRVFRLWLHRQLQLVVSEEVLAEYLLLIERLGIPRRRAEAFRERLRRRDIVTHVNLGTRFTESRDPDDNVMLATAAVGRARFLITNDRDLLDIPTMQRRKFKFEIVTPQEFLVRVTK
jgi:putative PIN family toxin of toxin-antitoxin system